MVHSMGSAGLARTPNTCTLLDSRKRVKRTATTAWARSSGPGHAKRRSTMIRNRQGTNNSATWNGMKIGSAVPNVAQAATAAMLQDAPRDKGPC